MSATISAKCPGCGNVVKVPVALGGKKARCPQCGDVITIPSPAAADPNSEIVADADLEEVAREGDVIGPDDEIIPAGTAPPAAEPEASKVRPAKGSVRRPGSSSRTDKVQGRGTQVRKPAPPRAAGSPTGLYIGIGVGVLALILAALGLSGGGEKKGPRKDAKDTGEDIVKPFTPPPAVVDSELEGRFLEWVRAVNRSEPKALLAFHAYPEADASSVRKAVYDLVGAGTRYENVTVKSADPASGLVAFSFAPAPGAPLQEKTQQWSRVEGVWRVQGKP